MDQSVGESPNATTVEETECSVTAGPSGATTEKNGGANDDVDDYADDGSNDDFDGVDDIDGAAAGPPNVVCVDGAAAGPSNVVTETPLYGTINYVDMSTSQCDNDCIFYAAERGVLCKHGARFCGQCQRMTFQDVCTCRYYYY